MLLCIESKEDLSAMLGWFDEVCRRRGLKVNASSVLDSSKSNIPNIWILRHALNESHLHEPHTLNPPCHSLPSPFFYLHSSPTHNNKPSHHCFRSSSNLPHRTKSSVCKRSSNLYSLPSSMNLTPLLPIPIFTSFITESIYTVHWKAKKTWCNTVSPNYLS